MALFKFGGSEYLVMPNGVSAEIGHVSVVPEKEGPVGVRGLLPVGDHARAVLVRLEVDGALHLGPADGAAGGKFN